VDEDLHWPPLLSIFPKLIGYKHANLSINPSSAVRLGFHKNRQPFFREAE
jgi:hypothetical protein